jgi:ABC-2 type transport system permease protein
VNALRAELVKFRTVPVQRRLFDVSTVVPGLVATLLLGALPVTTGLTVEATPFADVVSVAVLGIDAAAVLVVVLAALIGAWDLPVHTYALLPRRGQVVRAKAGVVALLGLAAGLLAAFGCVMTVWFRLHEWPAADGFRLAAGSALSPMVFGILALAGALVARSVWSGIVTGSTIMVLPTLLDWTGLAGLKVLLPAAGIHGLSGAAVPGDAEYLPVPLAVASLVVWAGVGVGGAGGAVRRRDV